MRKIYSLIGAIVFASSTMASAAGIQPNKIHEGLIPQGEVKAMQQNVRTLKSTPKTVTEHHFTSTAEMEGTWNMMYYYYVSQQGFTDYSCYCTIKAFDENTVTISNFWDEGTNEIEATVDFNAGTLSIPSGQLLGSTDYGTISLYSTDSDYTAPDTTSPIVLTINSDGVISTSTPWCVYIIDGTYKDMFYDYCYGAEFVKSNATMTMKGDGNTYYNYALDSYFENRDGNLVLGVANMMAAGFNDYVEFDIDPESKTATAQNQILYQDSSYQLYFYTFDGTNIDDSVTATISGENSNIIEFEDWTLYAGEDDNGNAQVTGQYGYTKITTVYNLLTGETLSGVKATTIDEDNAPVEYYNLQGMKIAQPTEKGIYIRRVGDKVSKIAL